MRRVNRRRWSLPLGGVESCLEKMSFRCRRNKWAESDGNGRSRAHLSKISLSPTTARAHTKAQGKYMTFVKRENCTVVKCFKPNMSSVDQCTGYCFASYKVVKRCCSVHWPPPKLRWISRKRRRMNVICIFDDFQACTFPRTWTDWRKFHMVGVLFFWLTVSVCMAFTAREASSNYTVSQKKQDTTVLAITSLTIIRFSNLF